VECHGLGCLSSGWCFSIVSQIPFGFFPFVRLETWNTSIENSVIAIERVVPDAFLFIQQSMGYRAVAFGMAS
jgi:hypothetical protein